MRILFVYSDPKCSCTIKNIFELSEGFKQIGTNVTVEYYLKIEEDHFKNFDVIMMHRFGGNAAIIDINYQERINFLINKYRGKVLTVYHIDDLLLNETIKNFIKMVDLVLVPNENYVPYYSEFNKNFSFINQTFIDPEKFNSVESLPNVNMNPHKFNIVWASTGLVGKSFMRKLIPKIEERFKEEICIYILGSGSTEFKSKNVRCYSNLSFELFVNFLKKSDLCLNPISIDTRKFRNVKTEDFINCKSEIKYCSAAICEIPIISGESHSYKKCIVNNFNGLILKNDINLWLDSIEKIKNDKNFKKTLINNALKDCLDNYTIVNASKIIRKIFEDNFKKILTQDRKVDLSLNYSIKKNNRKNLKLNQFLDSGNSVLGEINSHRKINQEILIRNNNFCKIQIKCATYNRENKGIWKIFVMLRFNDISSILREVEIDTSKIVDGEWVSINFDPIEESKNKKFFIQIQGVNCPLGKSATIYYDPSEISLGGFLYLNKSKISGNICLKAYCNI
jgi:hypothetical protein